MYVWLDVRMDIRTMRPALLGRLGGDDLRTKDKTKHKHPIKDWIGLSSVLRPRQHSIGYMGDGFYTSKDPTNSIKVLKETPNQLPSTAFQIPSIISYSTIRTDSKTETERNSVYYYKITLLTTERSSTNNRKTKTVNNSKTNKYN